MTWEPPSGGSVTLKEDQVQLVTDSFGDIPRGNSEGLGLYMSDTRHLSAFELLVDNRRPIYLSHSAERNYIATFQFVNHAMVMGDGTRVSRQTISIRRSRFVDRHGLQERIGFYNCNHFPVEIDVALTFDADFLDMFAIRQFAPQRRGHQSSVQLSPNQLTFSYVGRDNIRRRTLVHYDHLPEPISSNSMAFTLRLHPHVPESITLTIQPVTGRMPHNSHYSFDRDLATLGESYDAWHRRSTLFETNNEFFDRSLLRQSRLDIRALLEFAKLPMGNGESGRFVVPAAGIPWYAVPFGRDSIISSLQTLTYNPDIAQGTLRMLAQEQGTHVDPDTEEEPGKIFHELRRGELANLREIPHLPYYGTVDATPLFVVLFVETMDWLGQGSQGAQLYRDLLSSALKAVEWINAYGDIDGDGYVEHRSGHVGGVTNQGWKDSQDSLQYPDGQNAKLPAALVEVQGYVYQAKLGLSRLVGSADQALSDQLKDEAADLKKRFNRDFWDEAEGFFVQALDADKSHVPSVTSNAGHLLWSGILEEDKAERVVARLMAPDMFSGWGIRTLSSRSPNYNPMSYHNGSVWPHDNSIVAAGMRKYGYDREAAAVIEGIISAGLHFPGNRLPELFCGFPRDRRFNSSPAGYIVSCSPQAWAAAAPFLFLQTLLGIRPVDGKTLHVNPTVNDVFLRYNVKHMKVGEQRVSFEVHRRAEGFSLRQVEGKLRIASDTAAIE